MLGESVCEPTRLFLLFYSIPISNERHSRLPLLHSKLAILLQSTVDVGTLKGTLLNTLSTTL